MGDTPEVKNARSEGQISTHAHVPNTHEHQVDDAEVVSELQTTSGLFWERLRSSVNLPIVDSTRGTSHPVLDEENRRAAAEVKDGLDDFERRLERRRRGGPPGTSRVEWCDELSTYESMREDRSGAFEQSEVAAVAKTVRLTDAGIDVMDDGLSAFTSLTFMDLRSVSLHYSTKTVPCASALFISNPLYPLFQLQRHLRDWCAPS